MLGTFFSAYSFSVRCCVLALLMLTASSWALADAANYNRGLQKMPDSLVQALVAGQMPDAKGAMGRNRRGYFHVRFQTGMHRLAYQAVLAQDAAAADGFVRAMRYAFAQQQADGSFALQLPLALQLGKAPKRGDLASATAFFLSSAASGAMALSGSAWFKESAATQNARAQLAALRPGLSKSLNYLRAEQEVLMRADAKAPNRLLFDALAFYALGQYLDDQPAQALGQRFTALALQQQDPAGYFIEGGGFDSSYNGVALALGYQLLLMQPEAYDLKVSLAKALAWQLRRISDTGEIISTGNSRVYVGGESFLGDEKKMDVPHTVEALALARAAGADESAETAARRIVAHYRPSSPQQSH